MDILGRQAEIARSAQVRDNLSRLTAEVDAAETSLQRAVQVLEEAIVLGAQSVNDAGDQPDARDVLATKLGALHDELVRLSLTKVEGRFVFGGDEDEQAPYALNSASVNGVDRLTTAPSTRLILDVDGSRFLAGRTAQEIFDHRRPDDSLAPDNAFAAVHRLRVAVEADDTAQALAALDDLHLAHSSMNQQLAFYGGLQNRISRP
jgi:flagellin-like hook-associated protein FlgL